jgi:uncharacterized SAM-binding protein YcdF (DUF218 family)
MNTLILTLCAPNDDDGNLSQIAMDRLNCVLSIYRQKPGVLIICTGGIGSHFNNTALPHAVYAQNYLLKHGVQKENLGQIIASTNTFEDLSFAKPVVEKIAPDHVVIVTSDFHMERVQLIHKKIDFYEARSFTSAASTVSSSELEKLMLHEKEAIKRLMNE